MELVTAQVCDGSRGGPTHEATRKPHCRERSSPADLGILSAVLVRYWFTTGATYLPGPKKEKTADVGYLVLI